MFLNLTKNDSLAYSIPMNNPKIIPSLAEASLDKPSLLRNLVQNTSDHSCNSNLPK